MDATLERTAMTPSEQQRRLCRLRASYPFVYCRTLTATAGGRPLPALQIGQGDTKILLTAGHHANEYITSMLCWELIEGYMEAVECGGSFGGKNAAALFENAMLYVVPMVNPDGIDLVTGAITPDEPEYRAARAIAADYPELPFPSGAALDELALTAEPQKGFRPRVTDCRFSLSGMQNQVENKFKTEKPEDMARFALETVANAVIKATEQAKERYDVPVLCAGGVMASRVIRARMAKRFGSGVSFAEPTLSGDNAVGVAVLAARLYRKTGADGQ